MEMIRKFVFLRARQDVTRDAFVETVKGSYAKLLTSSDTFWKYSDRLVLSISLPAQPGVAVDPMWDAIIETWEKPRKSPLVTYHDEDDYRTTVKAAEDEFADSEHTMRFLAKEHIVIGGDRTGVKTLSMPRRRSGLTPIEFSEHYGAHGELVKQNPAFVQYARRYVQHHGIADSVARPVEFIPYDGISEFWFDTLADARAAWGDPLYMAQLRVDEKNFVGNPPSARLIVEEFEFTKG